MKAVLDIFTLHLLLKNQGSGSGSRIQNERKINLESGIKSYRICNTGLAISNLKNGNFKKSGNQLDGKKLPDCVVSYGEEGRFANAANDKLSFRLGI
jgi:hypothetical protein